MGSPRAFPQSPTHRGHLSDWKRPRSVPPAWRDPQSPTHRGHLSDHIRRRHLGASRQSPQSPTHRGHLSDRLLCNPHICRFPACFWPLKPLYVGLRRLPLSYILKTGHFATLWNPPPTRNPPHRDGGWASSSNPDCQADPTVLVTAPGWHKNPEAIIVALSNLTHSIRPFCLQVKPRSTSPA
jgi:hypothetical protein